MNPNEVNPIEVPQSEPRRAPWRQWGLGLDPEAVRQMANACALPVSVAGALMPDAHVGYGLPIGGVLATDNAVITYRVGGDIGCRVQMTVLDVPARRLARQLHRLTPASEAGARPRLDEDGRERRC